MSVLQFLGSLEVLEPYWLLLLMLLPPLVWFSFKNLASLGPVRRWLVLGLRGALVVFLALALAEAHARRPDASMTVLFLWDRSLSVPPEFEGEKNVRDARILGFINDAVAQRGPGHEQDRAGVIVFGRRPRLELPPASVPKLNFKKIQSTVDDTHTDLAAALKLALASFPEGSGKRIVLISDGNENLGRAEEQARIARQNGVQIDVLPLDAERRNVNEVLVDRLEAPPQTEKDSRLPLRIVLRSMHPQVVVGMLHLEKKVLELRKSAVKGLDEPVLVDYPDPNPKLVKLRQGLTPIDYPQPGAKDDEAFTYTARFVPLRIETPDGKLVQEKLPGDRTENNRASVSVMTRGERAVLIVEPKVGNHQLLTDRLRASKSSLKVVAVTPERLPQEAGPLGMVLSRFDAVILANIPAESLTETQQGVLRSNTHDQGAGLLMVGGNQSFGAGGWQNTEIEKALPVTMDLKSMKVEGKSGLVLIMHASEMAEGNAWQRKIAKLALEKLSPMDMIGQIHYDHAVGGHQWHIPFQQIGDKRQRLLGLVDSMEPGDMPDVDPAFAKAYKELTTPAYSLGTKHIILISDGDHWDASRAMLVKLKAAKITCTTVCITTHGQTEVRKMQAAAQVCGGRSYHIQNPNELPAIYIKETRLVSQSFVHEGKIVPKLRRLGPVADLNDDLPPLYGFVRTSRRPSPLVEVPIETPKVGEYTFPLLATWQYGLGKGIAFTSDARTQNQGATFWDKDWASAPLYARFWEQTVDWSLRPTETGKHLRITTEPRDGKVRVTLDAFDLDKTPLTDVEFVAGISTPGRKGDVRKSALKFEQKNAGVYEAEFFADEVGSYYLNVQAKWKKGNQEQTDSVRTGVSIPYSPEFAEMESNPALLDRLREITGGTTYAENDAALKSAARAGEVYRASTASQASLQPLWPWFVVLTALCLVLDVAVRRIALQPEVLWTKVANQWQRLRGKPTSGPVPEFIARLKNRKAQADETLEKQKAARRFDADPAAAAPPPAAPTAGSDAPPPKAPPPVAPSPKAAEPEDYFAKLQRAKKRAMEDRDKDKNS